MSDKLWKATERRIARDLASTRAHRPGKRSPDVSTELYAVEVKTRGQLPEWIKNALATARGHASGRQIGILVLHEKRGRDDLVVLSYRDFIDHFGAVK